MGNITKTLRRRITHAAGLLVMTLGLVVAPMAPVTVQADPVNSKPWNITAGPDGALWFTELDANRIGRITTSGAITEYTVPTANAGPYGIAAGPDNALWFTETNVSKIGRIGTDGTITEYDAPRNANNDQVKPTNITKGTDGTMWYAATGSIGRITTAGVATRYPIDSSYNNTAVVGITGTTSGVFFTLPAGYPAVPAIGRINVQQSNTIQLFPMMYGMRPTDINGEANDHIWFTSANPNPYVSGTIGSSLIWGMAEDGSQYSPFNIPANSNPSSIEVFFNGTVNFWYTGRDNNTVVRFMRGNGADRVTQLASGSCPQDLAHGSDDAMWFTEACSNKIGRVDNNGNLTEYPITGIPSAPTNLSATSPATQANLSWAASSGAASYNVYRNGTLVGSTGNVTYTDSPTSGNYNYYVKAVGNSGLESDASNTIAVTVATAPLVTIANPANNSTVSGTVNITGTIYSASTYSRMLSVFNSNGQSVASQYQFAVPNSTTTMSYSWDTTQVPNGVYTLNLSARDSQGNKDANSTSVVKVTVQN